MAVALLAILLAALPGWAGAVDFGKCGAGSFIPPAPIMPSPSSTPGAVDIEADDADLRDVGTSILRGNVVLRRDTGTLSVDELNYERETDTVDASGNLRVWKDDAYLAGTRGTMEMGDDVTQVEDAEYRVSTAHAHGSASRIVLTGSDVVKANDATYSTCDPDKPDWVLEADRIKLDKAEDRGSARDVWVTFKGVPIFYSPYLSFPLSDARKSGFLAAKAGVSSSTGVEATLPYYFNIAPNMDATVATRAMSERGLQLQGEFRYLFPWGEGILAGEVLPNDQKRDESRTGVSFRHRGDVNDRWRTDLQFDWVSDSEYFDDLGTSLDVSSQSFLEQRADLVYSSTNFYFRTRAQGFQTLDSTVPGEDRPYELLPQLYATTLFPEKNLKPTVNAIAEIVHFDRRDGVTGVRWDLRPNVTLPYRTASGFIVPRATIRYTGYALDDQATGTRDDPSRVLPTLSVDSGLFFERSLSFGSRPLLQTLEPRAFYLFTAFDNQEDLPVFDTGDNTFSFAQLFREDRFNGADRVGDANQLTLAVTSRLLDERTGAELASVSIGQIRYFRDRRVNLPGQITQTSRGSNIVAEVSANLDDRWRVSSGFQWDPDESQTDRNTVAVRYQPDERRVLNAAYRYVRETVEATDLSVAWPVSRDWRAVGRWNYALDQKRTVGMFAGFEYESCCWGFRLVGRRYLNGVGGDYNTGVFLQLVLKGLAGVGSADEFLGRNIPGYRNEF